MQIETHTFTSAVVKAELDWLAEGSCDRAYVFKQNGKEYVIKTYHGTEDNFPREYSLTQKVLFLNQEFRIASKYYPQEIVPTLYFIADNNKYKKPNLFTLQPHIIGKRGAQHSIQVELRSRWRNQVCADRNWQNFPENVRLYLQNCDLYDHNLLTTRRGQVKIIDL